MQEQPLEKPKEPEKEHRFLPRFVGLIAGVVSGIFTGKALRDMSLLYGVRDRLVSGKDEFVKKSFEKITGVAYEKEIKNNIGKAYLKVPYETLKSDFLKPAIDNLKKTIVTLKGAYTGARKRAGTIINKQDRTDKIRELARGLKYDIYRAEENIIGKPIYKKMIKDMGLGLGNSDHNRLIFATSGVALCAAGYAAYKATDWLMNHKNAKTHQQEVTDRRTNGESAGTAVT